MEDWNEMIKSFGRAERQRDRAQCGQKDREKNPSEQVRERASDRLSGGGGEQRKKQIDSIELFLALNLVQ